MNHVNCTGAGHDQRGEKQVKARPIVSMVYELKSISSS